MDFARRLSPGDCRLKVGSELFVKGGPELIHDLQQQGFEIFLDLKFNDIPNTVAAACRAARGDGRVDVHRARLGRTGHAGSSPREAAQDELHVVAITVLTSLDDKDLDAVGQRSAEEQVIRLAQLAQQANLSGIVCSAREGAADSRGVRTGFLDRHARHPTGCNYGRSEANGHP